MQMMRPRLVGGFVALLAFAAPAMQGPAQAYDNDVVALRGRRTRRAA